MDKYIFFLLAAMFFIQPVFAQDTAILLKNAEKIAASESEMNATREDVRELIGNIDDGEDLFESFVIIGANLWKEMENVKPFSEMDASNVIFKLPKFDASGNWSEKEEVKGKVFQEKEQFKSLLSFLKNSLDLPRARIAELNNRDKFIYWLYFAKLEDPLLAIDTGKARMILKFVKGKLFFIDLTSGD